MLRHGTIDISVLDVIRHQLCIDATRLSINLLEAILNFVDLSSFENV